MNEEVKIDSSFPSFESIEMLHTRSVSTPESTESVIMDNEEDSVESLPSFSSTPNSDVIPVRRGRGRPKGSKNRTGGGAGIPTPSDVETKLSGRLAKDVSLRTQQVLKGITRIPALWVEPIQMQDQEAQDIADPLASYATRKAEESTALGEFLRTSLENFDLVAAGIGISSYIIRVAKDIQEYNEYRRAEYRQQRSSEPHRETIERSRDMVPTDRPAPRSQQTRQSEVPSRVPNDNGSQDVQQAATWDFVSTPIIGQL